MPKVLAHFGKIKIKQNFSPYVHKFRNTRCISPVHFHTLQEEHEWCGHVSAWHTNSIFINTVLYFCTTRMSAVIHRLQVYMEEQFTIKLLWIYPSLHLSLSPQDHTQFQKEAFTLISQTYSLFFSLPEKNFTSLGKCCSSVKWTSCICLFILLYIYMSMYYKCSITRTSEIWSFECNYCWN